MTTVYSWETARPSQVRGKGPVESKSRAKAEANKSLLAGVTVKHLTQPRLCFKPVPLQGVNDPHLHLYQLQ